MSKIYVILVEYCMKLTLLSASKGSNYYKHVKKTYNFRIKSETGKSAITKLFYKCITFKLFLNIMAARHGHEYHCDMFKSYVQTNTSALLLKLIMFNIKSSCTKKVIFRDQEGHIIWCLFFFIVYIQIMQNNLFPA